MSREQKEYFNVNHLKAILRYKNLTQKEAAEICQISENHFSRIVTDEMITNSALKRLAKGLKIRPDFLTSEEWDKNINLDDPSLSWKTWCEETLIEKAINNKKRIISNFILLIAAEHDYDYYKGFRKLSDNESTYLYEILGDIVRYGLSDKGKFRYTPELKDIVDKLEKL